MDEEEDTIAEGGWFAEIGISGQVTARGYERTPKEQLGVHRGNDLKSELGRVLPETQFRPSQSFLFTFMEHAFVVGFSRTEQVEDDAR